jgi:hypothetical protein
MEVGDRIDGMLEQRGLASPDVSSQDQGSAQALPDCVNHGGDRPELFVVVDRHAACVFASAYPRIVDRTRHLQLWSMVVSHRLIDLKKPSS